MSKADDYRDVLRRLDSWDEYLLKESGLPGPRGNLELAQVVAEEGDRNLFERYLTYTPDEAPTNSPYEFLAFCGVVGLGRLLAEGDRRQLETLRTHSTDPRWRIREGVAMALQRLGDVDMPQLVRDMQAWAHGTHFEHRAAVAALCEPRLLGKAAHARATLQLLGAITAGVRSATDRRSEGFLALRKGLGYCWSVAVAALPEEGKQSMEKWMLDPDPDIRWIMRENLKKARLARMDAAWVKAWQSRLAGSKES